MNVPESRYTSSLVDIGEATRPGSVIDPVMHGVSGTAVTLTRKVLA